MRMLPEILILFPNFGSSFASNFIRRRLSALPVQTKVISLFFSYFDL